MKQPGKIRKLPITCLFVAVICMLTGRLRFPRRLRGDKFSFNVNDSFTVFRHMQRATGRERERADTAVFVVRFQFARFGQAVNRKLSLIPIPLIGGFPGFHEKIWMVNEASGEWIGLYEWQSELHAEAYEKSFVLRLMTRRAVESSVTTQKVAGTSISDYLQQIEVGG